MFRLRITCLTLLALCSLSKMALADGYDVHFVQSGEGLPELNLHCDQACDADLNIAAADTGKPERIGVHVDIWHDGARIRFISGGQPIMLDKGYALTMKLDDSGQGKQSVKLLRASKKDSPGILSNPILRSAGDPFSQLSVEIKRLP